MANSPQGGDVTQPCTVFGVPGLFVASSTMFPTSGDANPTLGMVALALRLADHLKAPAVEVVAPAGVAAVRHTAAWGGVSAGVRIPLFIPSDTP